MVYPFILLLHSALRWVVLGSILAVLLSAYSGLLRSRPYQPADHTVRIVATSVAHTQLLIGVYLYTISPLIQFYWREKPAFAGGQEFPFFALIHSSLMLTAVILMTIGSSRAKRQTEARERFRTTAVYFTIGLLLILSAIPWPFSPLAARPWVRY